MSMAAGEVVTLTQLNWTERAAMSEQMWPPGVCVVDVWVELLPCGQVEVRAELSDGCFLHLIRTDGDLARMMKRLVDAFPEDRETLSSSLLTGELTYNVYTSCSGFYHWSHASFRTSQY